MIDSILLFEAFNFVRAEDGMLLNLVPSWGHFRYGGAPPTNPSEFPLAGNMQGSSSNASLFLSHIHAHWWSDYRNWSSYTKAVAQLDTGPMSSPPLSLILSPPTLPTSSCPSSPSEARSIIKLNSSLIFFFNPQLANRRTYLCCL